MCEYAASRNYVVPRASSIARGTIFAMMIAAVLVLSAVAEAATDPQLTRPTGTLLPTGTKITGTMLNGTSKMWNTDKSSIQFECTAAQITGDVTKNTSSSVEANITSVSFGGSGGTAAGEPAPECTGTFGTGISWTPQVSATAPWCLRSLPIYLADEFRLGSGSCASGGSGKLQVIHAWTGLDPCTYESTGVLAGIYTTHSTGDAVLTVSASSPSKVTNGFTKLAGGNFLCPTSFQLEISFTLETDEAPATPIYIS